MFKKTAKKDFIKMIVLVLLVMILNIAWNLAGHRFLTTLFIGEEAAVVIIMLIVIIKRAASGAYKHDKEEVEYSDDSMAE